ncbi:NUDIX domain-containing protein [Pseudonocardia pini]|uniref:NUDIX domain-containing protein n=1 Tax=Pseudonocardia pini TaxID=2758030 RepID=UPI0015F04AB2|nr:NUDIX domain-containing protein [Pseudonocardia pini]
MAAAPLPQGSSGDGWQYCAQGHKHWGLYGAAGLLVRAGELVLLQHRALWSHHGGTWGIPGGARHLDESAESAARREAAEESELDTGPLLETARFVDDHGGWSYTTVVVRADEALPVAIRGGESVEFQWFRAATLGSPEGPDLHPGFAHTWPEVRDL